MYDCSSHFLKFVGMQFLHNTYTTLFWLFYFMRMMRKDKYLNNKMVGEIRTSDPLVPNQKSYLVNLCLLTFFNIENQVTQQVTQQKVWWPITLIFVMMINLLQNLLKLIHLHNCSELLLLSYVFPEKEEDKTTSNQII